MIIVRLKGGFANQLFQYSAARRLAAANGTEVLFDLSYLNKNSNGAYTQRKFELDQIKIKARTASDKELAQFRVSGLLDKVKNKLGIGQYLTLYETASLGPLQLKALKGNYLLDGYWQDERYFIEMRKELLDEIQPVYAFTNWGEELKKMILATNSVALHVRRGDYVSLKHANEFHGTCSLEYYRNAIDELKRKCNGLSYFIFSDDVDWCRKELSFLPEAVFVVNESEKKSSQDLFLMSLCRHNVIANSSYSWWAAWLNQNPNKTVISPVKWFKDVNQDTSNLIPKNWIRI